MKVSKQENQYDTDTDLLDIGDFPLCDRLTHLCTVHVNLTA